MILFIFQLVFYFVLGFSFVFFRRGYIGALAILVGAFFPYSPIFSAYFYYSGATVFDFFIIGVGIGALTLSFYSNVRFYLSLRSVLLISSFLLFLLISVIISSTNANVTLISALKDLKPVLLVFTLLYAYKIMISFNGIVLKDVVPASSLNAFMFSSVFPLILCMKLFFFLYLNSHGYLSSGSEDDFYVTDSEMLHRYADFSIIFVFIFTLFSLSSRVLPSIDPSYYSFLGIIMSGVAGNRTFFVIFLILLVYSLFRVHRTFFYLLFFITSSFCVVSFLFLDLDIDTGGRFFSLLSYENIVRLLSIRYSPLFSLYDDGVGYFNLLFGLGLGTLFYIPWFTYRDGIDPYSPFIDNFYLTIFAKFGLFGLFAVMFFLLSICFSSLRKGCARFLYPIIFIMYTTTMSFWYQSSFSYFAICWFTVLLFNFECERKLSKGYNYA